MHVTYKSYVCFNMYNNACILHVYICILYVTILCMSVLYTHVKQTSVSQHTLAQIKIQLSTKLHMTKMLSAYYEN